MMKLNVRWKDKEYAHNAKHSPPWNMPQAWMIDWDTVLHWKFPIISDVELDFFLQKMEKPTVRLSNPKKLHGFKKSPWLTGPFKPLKSANSTLQWKCLAHTPYPYNTWVLPRNVHAQTTVSEQEIKQGTPPTDLIQRRRPRIRGRNSWYTKCRSTHLHMITPTQPTSKACGWKHFADFASL